jgi:FkbM family methyltransferase
MSGNSKIDPLALGSDVARSRRQFWARKLAGWFVSTLGLNGGSLVATEIVQAINPVVAIATAHGVLRCRGGHGRLVWRARTFHTEEPETVHWLDSLTADDVYWDIGANVGLYAIYAAKFRGCRVVAFEPEAQNYALFIENLVLNEVDSDRLLAAPIAIGRTSGFGRLEVRYLTKGGAYNLFRSAEANHGELPDSIRAAIDGAAGTSYRQLSYGSSIDDLVLKHGLPAPTHIKIDVDGNEPAIVAGCQGLLTLPSLRSLLVEINKRSAADLAIVEILRGYGFKVASDTSVWNSKRERSREDIMPATNIIFVRMP